MNDAFLPFTESERLIYRYHDGSKIRAADPMVAYESLRAVENLALADDLKLAGQAGNPLLKKESEEAVKRLTDASRQVFQLPAFSDSGDSPTGLTNTEAFAVLVNFVEFVGGLADKAGPFLNSPESTGLAASVASDTASFVDSGSIESESPTNETPVSA